MNPQDPKAIAQAASAFSKTPFGKFYLEALSLQYNGLHHEAEGDLTIEQKALKVERAAGLKWAIDFLTQREANLKNGYFDKK